MSGRLPSASAELGAATFASLWDARRDTIMAHRARIRVFLASIVDEGLEPGPFRTDWSAPAEFLDLMEYLDTLK